jgi:hypothetical protein
MELASLSALLYLAIWWTRTLSIESLDFSTNDSSSSKYRQGLDELGLGFVSNVVL